MQSQVNILNYKEDHVEMKKIIKKYTKFKVNNYVKTPKY